MSDTYRLSAGNARRDALVVAGIVLLVCAGVLIKTYLDDPDSPVLLSAVLIGAVIAFVSRRNYKRATEIAANHSLSLGEDAIVLRDGPTETRIPYSAIESMRVRRPLAGTTSFTLKITGLSDGSYWGYDDMDRLIASLATRLPRDRVEDKGGHL